MTIPPIETTDIDLFTRPPRAVRAMPPTLATVEIVCAVCGATQTVPVLWPARLCRQCKSNPLKAQERALNQWTQAQVRALDADTARYLNVMQERYEARQDVLRRFLQVTRQPRQDTRQLGDSPRVRRVRVGIESGMTDQEIIVFEQTRVAKRIAAALAARDGLADILRAEHRYHDAMEEIARVMEDIS